MQAQLQRAVRDLRRALHLVARGLRQRSLAGVVRRGSRVDGRDHHGQEQAGPSRLEGGDLKGQVERLEALVADIRNAYSADDVLLLPPVMPEYSPTNTFESCDVVESEAAGPSSESRVKLPQTAIITES